MIRLDSVSKRFRDGTVPVSDLTLEVPEGEICVPVGPPGCGKTHARVMRCTEPAERASGTHFSMRRKR